MVVRDSKQLAERPDRHTSFGPVCFLMNTADGPGGIARTVVNLANHLASRHEVQVISVYRRSESPAFRIHPEVRISYLVDDRKTSPRWTDPARRPTRPSVLVPVGLDRRMSTDTDAALEQALGSLAPGILVSSRPSLHAAAVHMAPSNVIKVGQEHLNFLTRMENPKMGRLVRSTVPRLDCWVTLTEEDAADYARLVAGSHTRVTSIPNGLPWPVASRRAPLTSKTIVSAGRLVPQKGFDLLIEAFAAIARSHPDWNLHIYGQGHERRALRQLIKARGVGRQVKLKGYSNDLPRVLADSAAYVLSSRFEGFGMVLIEAASQGVPLVSFDCRRGPAEIVADGRNGLLVPDGDVNGLTRAIARIVEDGKLRRRLGAGAYEDARMYEMPTIVERWETLFGELSSRATSEGRPS